MAPGQPGKKLVRPSSQPIIWGGVCACDPNYKVGWPQGWGQKWAREI
jgi:hypothetical protein